jgi:hypothetical protein
VKNCAILAGAVFFWTPGIGSLTARAVNSVNMRVEVRVKPQILTASNYRMHQLRRLPGACSTTSYPNLMSTLFSINHHLVSLTSRIVDISTMATHTPLADMPSHELLRQVKKFIPPLLERFHKGLSPLPGYSNKQLTQHASYQASKVVSP